MSVTLTARRMGIDTYHEPILFLHRECSISRVEGLEVQSRVLVRCAGREAVARLNVVTAPIMNACEAGFSESLWAQLHLEEGAVVTVEHAPPLYSFGAVRGKIAGHDFEGAALRAIMADIIARRYSGVEMAAFLTACSGHNMRDEEVTDLTRVMVESGTQLDWGSATVLDKHCVGGLPGNRTTPIIVAIVAANGLLIPKTSSRAITSPAGTADMMEVLAPVDLDLAAMRKVVEKEGGCVVWGGRTALSPADDILIRVERQLDLESDGQLVASVLSKKIAAGARQVLIDIPVGKTAKIRSLEKAQALGQLFMNTAEKLGLQVAIHTSLEEGPVGRGIGPALEARDVVQVLRDEPGAPADLKARALALAARVLAMAPGFTPERAGALARETLEGGRAWQKFQAICDAQGGLRSIPAARLRHEVCAGRAGRLTVIHNRNLARVAKYAGAPHDKAAGLDLHVQLGAWVEKGQPLFTLHAETTGERDYALSFMAANTLFEWADS